MIVLSATPVAAGFWVPGPSVEIKNSETFIRRWNLTRKRIVTQPSQAFKEKEDGLPTS